MSTTIQKNILEMNKRKQGFSSKISILLFLLVLFREEIQDNEEHK